MLWECCFGFKSKYFVVFSSFVIYVKEEDLPTETLNKAFELFPKSLNVSFSAGDRDIFE